MNFEELREFAMKIRNRLYDELNGSIRFVIYESENSISFNISFKDFTHQALIKDVDEKIYKGVSVEEIVDDILKAYKAQVLKCFFKSEYKKRRDTNRLLGCLEEVKV